jgi:RNA polymerase sigma-70 factor (ECF subfamily)
LTLLVQDAAMDDRADRSDVAASLKGDSEAYRRLIDRHQQQIAKRMRRFARDVGTVEQLVQDVFVEAWCSLAGYSAKAPFEHWLNRIATFIGYAHLKRQMKERKKQNVEIVLENQAANDPPSNTADQDDAKESLHRILDQLSPRDRLVITLLYLEERSVAETSKLTGWSQPMVKVQAFRARGKLRKLLEAQND